MRDNPDQSAFADVRAAALALLNSDAKLSSRAGSFLGQLAVEGYATLSEKQRSWLERLLEQAGLPPFGSQS